MNLRSVDLNLLVVFEALMAERHVTRAARRVGLSQPAMSNALGRLRQLFDDELLVRSGAGMEPTARALDLAEQVRPLLRQVDRIVSEDAAFDAATATDTFRLRIADLLSFIVTPALMAALAREAPEVAVDIVHLTPEATVEALVTDALDIAVSMDLAVPQSIVEQPILEDRFVTLLRADHPERARIDTMEGFLACRHVRISQSPVDDRFVEGRLAARGMERRVALTVPHWLTVPPVLAATDLVAVISAHAARRLIAADDRLAIAEAPFERAEFSWSLFWHKRHRSRPAHRWFRETLADIAGPTSRR